MMDNSRVSTLFPAMERNIMSCQCLPHTNNDQATAAIDERVTISNQQLDEERALYGLRSARADGL